MGRQISSIEKLPPEADDTIIWVRRQILSNRSSQTDILKEFNGRLLVLGIEPISPSSFNRHSQRIREDARGRSVVDVRDQVLTRLADIGRALHLVSMYGAEEEHAGWMTLCREDGDMPKTIAEAITILTRRVEEIAGRAAIPVNSDELDQFAGEEVRREPGLSCEELRRRCVKRFGETITVGLPDSGLPPFGGPVQI